MDTESFTKFCGCLLMTFGVLVRKGKGNITTAGGIVNLEAENNKPQQLLDPKLLLDPLRLSVSVWK